MPSWSSILSWETSTRESFSIEDGLTDEKMNFWENMKPNPGSQSRFLEMMNWKDAVNNPSDLRWGLFGAGIGTGKSFCGAAWLVSRCLLDPKARHLITALSYGQISRASALELAKVCRIFNVPLDPQRESIEDTGIAIANLQRCYVGQERAFVYVLSAHSFLGASESGRGLSCRSIWADEWARAPEQAFLTIDGRLGRGEGTIKGQGIITSSLAGYNWVYNRFGDPTRSPDLKRIYQMVTGSTRENVGNLGEEYVRSLEANYGYDSDLAKQELEGMFVSTAQGLIYKYFNRNTHALRDRDEEILEYDRTLPLLLTFDFNYSPAVAIAAQRKGNEIHFFKEWYMMDSDIWELANTIADWILLSGSPPAIEIYGDATGRARTAASRLSSWDIVFEAIKHLKDSRPLGVSIHRRFDDSNPHVVNRIHSVNRIFQQNRCYISFSGCPELIKDFESIDWTAEGIDKSDRLRSHLSDAAGYLIHKIEPFKVPRERKGGDRFPKGIAA